MKKYVLILSLLGNLLFFTSCQKELSLEISSNPSSGSLQANVSGDCLPKTVQGIYEAGTALVAADHYIDVQVNVTEAGAYRVYSDTTNGMFFQAKGSFATVGLNTVRIVGNGTPLTAGVHHFTIMYDSTECLVAVTVLPKGGADPANFTLSGGPNTCLDFALSGSYIKDVPLGAANTVAIKVNVTTIGTYSITTQAANGITFSGTGVFTALGDQTITLTAAGTPLAIENTKIDISAGTSACSFTLNVTAGATFAVDCGSATINGTYTEGAALDASNTIELGVTVATAGPYSITTTAVNGMTFSGSGNFTTTGAQTITLTGAGTPAADGAFDISMPGSAPCNVEINVEPGAVATDLKWKFTSGGVTYEGPTGAAITVGAGGMESTGIMGQNTAGDINFSLSLTKMGSMQAGTFSTATAPPGNMATLMVMNNSGQLLFTGILGSGSLTVNLTTYNETTKIAEGTFSGTAVNASNATVQITNGTFKAEIQ